MLMVWVRSFSKLLPSVKFAEDNVLVFVILREKKMVKQCNYKSNSNPNPNFHSRLIR